LYAQTGLFLVLAAIAAAENFRVDMDILTFVCKTSSRVSENEMQVVEEEI